MWVFFLFIIYSFLFLCLGGSVISYYLNVSPFACLSLTTGEVFINPFSDWYRLYNLFKYGNWAVDSTENLIIFLAFILFFPAWILCWFLLCRIKWKKIIFKLFGGLKFHRAEPQKAPVLAKNIAGRPVAMPKMRGFGRGAMTPTDLSEQKNADSDANEGIDHVSTSSSETSPTITAVQKEQLRVLGEKYGYELFEGVHLDKYMVPFVFATDTLALVTSILLDNREWIADETPAEGDSEPTWFSAEGLITSPFYQMVEAGKLLKEKEPDSQVVPVVVIANGSVLNVSAVEEQWKEQGGFVVLWNEGIGEGLSTLEDLLKSQAQESLADAIPSEDNLFDEPVESTQDNVDMGTIDSELEEVDSLPETDVSSENP